MKWLEKKGVFTHRGRDYKFGDELPEGLEQPVVDRLMKLGHVGDAMGRIDYERLQTQKIKALEEKVKELSEKLKVAESKTVQKSKKTPEKKGS